MIWINHKDNRLCLVNGLIGRQTVWRHDLNSSIYVQWHERFHSGSSLRKEIREWIRAGLYGLILFLHLSHHSPAPLR